MDNILWDELDVVVFDVDGTLYCQSKLRKIMLLKLVLHYVFRPWKYRELLVIYHFRKEREKRAGYRGSNLQEEQYNWCAQKTNEKLDFIKRVVGRWIFEEPNRYLKECMYPGVSVFIELLKKKGIRTAIYSDYESIKKLKCMDIKVDLEVSSTDPEINSFKPNSEGLTFILSKMKAIGKDKCLFIGDRYELDGLCARELQVPFLLIKEKTALKGFYVTLADKISISGYNNVINDR